VRDDDLNSRVLLLWDGLRLDAGRELAADEVFDESGDFLLCELVALEGIFLILDGLLNSEGREGIGRKVEVSSMSSESFGIDNGEVELALVHFSDRLECLGELGALFRGLGEDVGQRNASLRMSIKSFQMGAVGLTAM
jgi:hypothetical protein